MVRLDLISQEVQYLLANVSWVLADLQKIMIIRRKTCHISAVLVHPVFTFIIIMVRVFTHLEMMYFLIHTNGDRVIFHVDITNGAPYCL